MMKIQSIGGGSAEAEDILAWQFYVKNKISDVCCAPATTTLTTSGATDLDTAIAALNDGDILEVKTNAVYDPINIVAGAKYSIRVAFGYSPKIAGSRCIRLRDGASGVLISGLTIDTHDLGGRNANGEGSAITFEDLNMIVDDVIFHNITIKNVPTTGSSVLLAYHQSRSGDTYTTPNVYPGEFSNRVAFVDCNAYKASDGIEHAAFTVRGVERLYFDSNNIDGQNNSTDSRGIQCQNCIGVLIENNDVMNTYVGNGEGIKIDKLGAPAYFNTCWIKGNRVHHCIEGIDVDDAVEALVEENQVWDCQTEGISIDNNSQAVVRNNTVFYNDDGIRFENGSIYEVKGNNSFDNAGLNYLYDDGVGLADNTNLSNPYSATNPIGIMNEFITRWNDLRIPLTAGKLGVTSPPTFNVLRGALRAFDFSIGDEMFFGTHIPHDYKSGTVLYPHVHWTSDGIDVNIVRWNLEYEIVIVGNAFPVGTSSLTIDGTPSGVAYTHYIDEHVAGFALTNLAIGSFIMCRISRITNAGTDNTDAIFGLEVDFHYQIENVGTKNRMPPLNNRLIP